MTSFLLELGQIYPELQHPFLKAELEIYRDSHIQSRVL